MTIGSARKMTTLAALVLTVAVAFFGSPKGGRVCTVLVKIAGPLDYVFLCDSPRFMEVAAHPSLLFDASRLPNGAYPIRWQTRPLFVLTASLLAVPLAPVLPVVGIGPHPYHLTFVLMNYVVVVVAIVLFDRLFSPRDRLVWSLVAVALPLVANDVVKERFWSPHTQMFNILAPVVSMVACRWLLVTSARDWRRLVPLGLVAGFLVLYYGTFIAVLAAMLLTILWRDGGRAALGPALGVTVGGVAPPLAWAVLVRSLGGVLYSPEITEYRQFVWMFDVWRHGRPAFHLLERLVDFGASCGSVLWWPAVLLGLVLLAAPATGVSSRQTIDAQRETVTAALMTLLAFGGFLFALGSYPPRLCFGLVPPILALSGAVVAEVLRRTTPPRARRFAAVVCAAALVHLGIVLATHGV